MPGVYVSYPFCAQKCTYCNFASGVFPRPLEARYLAALEAEVRAHAWQWRPETVYLGGGTPSQIAPDALQSLLAAIPGNDWNSGADPNVGRGKHFPGEERSSEVVLLLSPAPFQIGLPFCLSRHEHLEFA